MEEDTITAPSGLLTGTHESFTLLWWTTEDTERQTATRGLEDAAGRTDPPVIESVCSAFLSEAPVQPLTRPPHVITDLSHVPKFPFPQRSPSPKLNSI